MADQAVAKPKRSVRIKEYFKGIRSEVKKVVWPTKKTVVNNTLVVLAFIIFTGVFVGAFDTLTGWLLKLVLSK